MCLPYLIDELQRAQETLVKAELLEQKVKELEDTREQLIRSAKLASLGKLAAGIAHEINNPLAIVLNYSHIMLRRVEEGSPHRKSLETIIRNITRCSEIVKGLLDFSKEEKPLKKKININQLLKEILSLLENHALFFNIEIEMKLEETLPEIMADPNQLQQAFLNIMVNAAESMREGGKLIIKTDVDRDYINFVRIEFTDTGCGIPPENMDKIFDPFFTTKENEGLGLGLAITYSIIQRHSGYIDVKSKLGIGSTFIVRLPMTE
jgi:two-component system NtrC family sensor kinase